MAKINVNTNVTAPAEINIPLVRADYADTSNVFRIFFEIFMSFFFCLLGFILGQSNISLFHWITLIVCGLMATIFLILLFRMNKKSQCV